MSLNIPDTYVRKYAKEGSLLASLPRSYGDEVLVPSAAMTPAMIEEIRQAAEHYSVEENVTTENSYSGRKNVDKALMATSKSLGRVLEAIALARSGKFDKSIPSLKAGPEIMLAFLRHNLADGWIYTEGRDGHLHARLVTDIKVVEPSSRGGDDKPSISMSTVANNPARSDKSGTALTHQSYSFSGEEVTRKRVSEVFMDKGIYIETPALREQYDRDLAHYEEVLISGFAQQYILTGQPQGMDDWRRDSEGPRSGAKVIHDIHRSQIGSRGDFAYSDLFLDPGKQESDSRRRRSGEAAADEDGVGPVPTQFSIKVFDLATHDFLWVNSTDLTRYVYDPTLATKIVLPEDQRDLLDILTHDLDAFVGDVIAGKSAGNVVLCKGEPGVGKTLTAEVYSEIIERPLYSIHSGTLGVNAKDVRENLEVVFKRAKRWSCVLLLDEADVFVLERGHNISQNAIVAEFLRTMEYFDGLLFMTTNRANNIDDAILSRAAAIIDYDIPSVEAIREIWEVQAANNSVEIPKDLLDLLVHGFEHITGRDVKMLLRLALRVSHGKGVPLDHHIVAKCATFRGLHFKPGSRQ